jgi:septum formation protein
MGIILASSSPSRAEILNLAGLDIKKYSAQIDEEKIKNENKNLKTNKLALKLAQAKAIKISNSYLDDYVIGADQILQCENKRFDKPYNMTNAKKQLQALRGKEHFLINGVSIYKNKEQVFSYDNKISMHMRDFSDMFLEKYLNDANKNILYSCGSYMLEGIGSQLFSKIDGDFFSVLGMPLLPILEFFRKEGVLEK